MRSQSEAGLPAEADRALLAWEDPEVEVWRSSSWPGVPMLTVARVGLSVIRRKPSTTDTVNSAFGEGSNLAFWRAKLGWTIIGWFEFCASGRRICNAAMRPGPSIRPFRHSRWRRR